MDFEALQIARKDSASKAYALLDAKALAYDALQELELCKRQKRIAEENYKRAQANCHKAFDAVLDLAP